MNKCVLFTILNLMIIRNVLSENHGLYEEYSINSYTRCRVDSDCMKMSDNSFCFDNDADKVGFCKCREGYDMVSRNKTFFACLGPAGFGEPCEKNMQCQLILTENSECYESTCRCKDGSHLYKDGRCYVSVLLDDYCSSDGNCWMMDNKFGNCVYGKCICPFDKQVPNTEKNDCIEGRNLGESCDNDNQCILVENTQCRVTCRCATGFVLSRDETRCLRAATRFFDYCEENEQCSAYLQGSTCISNNCTCSEGFHNWNTQCVRSAGLGGYCSSIEECIPDPKFSNVINCIDGNCQCLPGSFDEQLGCNRAVSQQAGYIFIFILSSSVLKFL
ncbi:prion-like-(Q/N-rich) domain-bearing protein 25 [Diorhabda carinulata]|uniref:prion-like-(Q/N-rich) domain-bearing protein 25 n=1 Tax=Diorhabda carinulata TaxID=1163345 RepID=UPI0025A11F25|nr:prion-like-(Q/N-rich) domain-bearing protein 25 [Diorhabda carinulata]